MTEGNPFVAQALAEIDGLHRVLQAWFRAEGRQDAEAVLAHFDPAYTFVTPVGKVVTFEMFKAGLAGLWGSRPDLVMEITHEAVVFADTGSVSMTYHERQSRTDAVTDRISTVVMVPGPAGAPVWRHHQETMLA